MVAAHGEAPLVVVLMATHRGERWLEEQARSILDQRGARVRLVVSDDASPDGTSAVLARLAEDDRVTLLPPERFGTPQANFLRLVRDADTGGATAVAFADQDDVWHPDKLERQLALLERHGVDAVSSNVTAFWELPDGSRRTAVIDKAQPQTTLDFLLESAGPGSTFLLDAEAFAAVRDVVRGIADPSLVPHDWLVYAIVRATGRRWRIDAEPTLDYRQHGENATGANHGLRSAAVRAARLASGDYRRQCAAVAALAASIADDPQRARLERIAPLFGRTGVGARAALRRLAPELRREPRERTLLRLALLVGAW